MGGFSLYLRPRPNPFIWIIDKNWGSDQPSPEISESWALGNLQDIQASTLSPFLGFPEHTNTHSNTTHMHAQSHPHVPCILYLVYTHTLLIVEVLISLWLYNCEKDMNIKIITSFTLIEAILPPKMMRNLRNHCRV